MSLLNIKIDFLNLTKLFNFIIGGKDSYNKHSGELLAKRNDELDRNLIELLGNVKLSIANESLIYEENSLPQIFYLYDFLIKYEKRYFRNTNDLINRSSKYYYEYAIGTKTGYTTQAKRCLIATAAKDNLELITIILGDSPTMDDSRYLDTIKMFEYGFLNYKTQKIATKNNIIKEIKT